MKKNLVFLLIFIYITFPSFSANRIDRNKTKIDIIIEADFFVEKSKNIVKKNLQNYRMPSFFKCIIEKGVFYVLNNKKYNNSSLHYSTIEKDFLTETIDLPKHHFIRSLVPFIKKMDFKSNLTRKFISANDVFKKRFSYIEIEEMVGYSRIFDSCILYNFKIDDLLQSDKIVKPVVLNYSTCPEDSPIFDALSFADDFTVVNYTGHPVFYDISISIHGIYCFLMINYDFYVCRLENKKWIYDHKIPIKFNDPFYAVVFKDAKYVVTSDHNVYKVKGNKLDLIAEISDKSNYCIIDKTRERLFFAPLISNQNKEKKHRFQIIQYNRLEKFEPDELTVQAIKNVVRTTK